MTVLFLLLLLFSAKNEKRFFIACVMIVCAGENEKRLVYDLFEKNGYNPLIRPVQEVNHSLQINFSLALSQIISIVSSDHKVVDTLKVSTEIQTARHVRLHTRTHTHMHVCTRVYKHAHTHAQT